MFRGPKPLAMRPGWLDRLGTAHNFRFVFFSRSCGNLEWVVIPPSSLNFGLRIFTDPSQSPDPFDPYSGLPRTQTLVPPLPPRPEYFCYAGDALWCMLRKFSVERWSVPPGVDRTVPWLDGIGRISPLVRPSSILSPLRFDFLIPDAHADLLSQLSARNSFYRPPNRPITPLPYLCTTTLFTLEPLPTHPNNSLSLFRDVFVGLFSAPPTCQMEGSLITNYPCEQSVGRDFSLPGSCILFICLYSGKDQPY